MIITRKFTFFVNFVEIVVDKMRIKEVKGYKPNCLPTQS